MSKSQIAPISLQERIEILDVLRGLAVCGILIGNMLSLWTTKPRDWATASQPMAPNKSLKPTAHLPLRIQRAAA